MLYGRGYFTFTNRTSVIVWVGLVFPFIIYFRDYLRDKRNARKAFELGNTAKVKTTKHFIVLTTKAQNFVVLAKDGFVKGNTKDFMAFLQSRMQ